MKKLILLAALATSFCFGQTTGPLGSATNPITDLSFAWLVNPGYHHFLIGGHTFYTKVQDSCVLVAQDRRTTPPVAGLVQTSSIGSSTTIGLLNSSILLNLSPFTEIRVTGPTIKYKTTSPQALTNLRNFKPLLRGNHVSTSSTVWTSYGVGVTSFNASCQGSFSNPTLSQVILHACQNTEGIHWVPDMNDSYVSHQMEIHNLGNVVQTGTDTVSALRLWVRASPPANLPVELIHFGANCEEDGGALISWTTASEHNSDYYLLEQSNDGETWYETEKEKAIGNSTDLFTYEVPVTHSENYFRLTQYDVNGRHTTYDVISLNCEEEGKFKVNVFPNPTKEYLIISISNEEVNKTYTAVLKDLSGVEVYKADVPVESGTTIFKTEFLIPGMYTLTVGGKTSLIVKL